MMATGAVLLSRVEAYIIHAKRIARMMVVLLVFSFFFLYMNNEFPTSLEGTGQAIKTLIGKPATNALWYLYLYIGILFAMPFLQRLVNAAGKKDIEYLLFISLFLFGLFYSITHGLGIQVYGKIDLTFFSYPVGYLCAGYYINKYVELTGRLFIIALLAFVFSVGFAVIVSWQQYDLGYVRYLGWSDLQSLNTVTESLSFFYIVKFITESKYIKNFHKSINIMASCVFGTYLISDFVLVRTYPFYLGLLENMHPLFACVLWQIFIFSICMAVVYFARVIPLVRRYI